jgi:hypothetical protein
MAPLVLSQRIARAGLPALGLCTEHGEYVAGEGTPGVTVTTTRWELFRALYGRRSESQICDYREFRSPLYRPHRAFPRPLPARKLLRARSIRSSKR